MDAPPNGQAVDLSQPRGAAVREIQLVPAAMVDGLPNGLTEPAAIGHLRVVNLAAGVAWLIPAPERFCRTLIGQLQELVDNHDQSRDPALETGDRT